MLPFPPATICGASVVIGKSGDRVEPVSQTLSEVSTDMACTRSSLLASIRVVRSSVVPSVVILTTYAAKSHGLVLFDGRGAPGKSIEHAVPPTYNAFADTATLDATSFAEPPRYVEN